MLLGKDDIKRITKTIKDSFVDPTTKELLADELVPFLAALADAASKLEKRLNEQDEIISDLIENEGDMIHPDLAAVIIDALQAGEAICDFIVLKGLSAGDDIADKKLAAAITEYKQKAMRAVKEVMEVVIEDDEDDEDDEDEKEGSDEDDGSGDDGRDGDDGDADTTAEEEGTAAEETPA